MFQVSEVFLVVLFLTVCFKEVRCPKGVLKIFQENSKGVPIVFQGRFKGLSSKSHNKVKDASRDCTTFFKGALR